MGSLVLLCLDQPNKDITAESAVNFLVVEGILDGGNSQNLGYVSTRVQLPVVHAPLNYPQSLLCDGALLAFHLPRPSAMESPTAIGPAKGDCQRQGGIKEQGRARYLLGGSEKKKNEKQKQGDEKQKGMVRGGRLSS